MTVVRALHLVSRPDGHPKDSDFQLRESPALPLQDGQIRVAVRYLSIDPAMRVWMTEAKSYWPPVALGEVMRSAGIGEVIESHNEKFPVGSWVSGMTGVQGESVSDGKGMQRFDARKLPHPGWALSIFGATG
ncbi:MAG: NADP-dependent oxidoreductase, partial [Arenimonas sp.]